MHFLEPRNGAGELKPVAALGINPFRRLGRRRHEMQAGIIKRVNQQDKALGLIALAGLEGRDFFDEQRLKVGGERQIIGRTQAALRKDRQR